MRTVIVSVIGISSLFLVVMIQRSVTTQMWQRDRMEESLSTAMKQTLSEVMEKNCYGIENRNEMMAAFLQSMIRRINEDVDLTVKVHHLDYDLGQMDVEVMGRFYSEGDKSGDIRVRRKMVFVN